MQPLTPPAFRFSVHGDARYFGLRLTITNCPSAKYTWKDPYVFIPAEDVIRTLKDYLSGKEERFHRVFEPHIFNNTVKPDRGGNRVVFDEIEGKLTVWYQNTIAARVGVLIFTGSFRHGLEDRSEIEELVGEMEACLHDTDRWDMTKSPIELRKIVKKPQRLNDYAFSIRYKRRTWLFLESKPDSSKAVVDGIYRNILAEGFAWSPYSRDLIASILTYAFGRFIVPGRFVTTFEAFGIKCQNGVLYVGRDTVFEDIGTLDGFIGSLLGCSI